LDFLYKHLENSQISSFMKIRPVGSELFRAGGQDKTRQDKTRQDKTRQDKTRQDKTRQDKTRQDTAKLNIALDGTVLPLLIANLNFML
jgi:hypothetical protein